MKKRNLIITSLMLVLLTLPLSACSKKTNVDKVNNQLDKVVLPNEKDGYVSLDLYFGSKDNTKLEKEERYINKEEMIGEQMILELITGPTIGNDVNPIFPKDTKLISFSIKDSIAYINFSNDIKSIDINSEKLVLMSLVKTLTQLPSVTKVQIIINNEISKTLAGGYDISKPFTENIDIIKMNN